MSVGRDNIDYLNRLNAVEAMSNNINDLETAAENKLLSLRISNAEKLNDYRIKLISEAAEEEAIINFNVQKKALEQGRMLNEADVERKKKQAREQLLFEYAQQRDLIDKINKDAEEAGIKRALTREELEAGIIKKIAEDQERLDELHSKATLSAAEQLEADKLQASLDRLKEETAAHEKSLDEQFEADQEYIKAKQDEAQKAAAKYKAQEKKDEEKKRKEAAKAAGEQAAQKYGAGKFHLMSAEARQQAEDEYKKNYFKEHGEEASAEDLHNFRQGQIDAQTKAITGALDSFLTGLKGTINSISGMKSLIDTNLQGSKNTNLLGSY